MDLTAPRDPSQPWLTQGEEKRRAVQNMFARIAPGYDRMNRLMTANSDRTWRRKAVQVLQVKPGQKVAVVGPTGAGKSSIISLLSRLYDIQGGDIKIDGHSIYDLKLGYLRSQISVVLQDPFIFSGPIIDNITLLSPISREKAREAARLVGAEDFILKLPEGYDYVLTERGATLSVGQRQLLSFARAIAHDPRILVLDEATSSIDTASETLIQEAMKNMMAGRTSIVVAHRLSTIKDADLVLVISDGKIAESGSHDELLKKGGMYKTLYELQFKAQERNS